MYDKHASIASNKAGHINRHIEPESEFCGVLENLFYIRQADCENMVKIPEDWCFLQDQQQERKMTMGEEDLEFRMHLNRRQEAP